MRQCLIVSTILRIAFIDAPGMHLRKSSPLEFFRVRTCAVNNNIVGIPFKRHAAMRPVHPTIKGIMQE